MKDCFLKIKKYADVALHDWSSNAGNFFEIEAGGQIYEASISPDYGTFAVKLGSSIIYFSVTIRCDGQLSKTFPISVSCSVLNREEVDSYYLPCLEDLKQTLKRFFMANVVMLYFASLTESGIEDLAKEIQNHD